MKSGFGCDFMFIHVMVLGALAKIIVEDGHWPILGGILFWIVISASGLIPIIRTFVLLGLLLFLVMWWKALLMTVAISLALLFIEQIGKVMMMKQNSQ